MPLFDLQLREDNDSKIIKKSKTKSKTTVKKTGNLLSQMQTIVKTVDEKLGYLADECILIQDVVTLNNYIDNCISNKIISIDTETTGLDPLLDDIAGVCIYTPGEKGAYIPINHINYITNIPLANQLTREEVRDALDRFVETKNEIVMFNAVFDIRVLRNTIGLHNIYCTWDCYVAQRLLNENEPSNALKKLHQKYVLDGQVDAFTFDELFKGITFTMVPLQTACLYASHDPKITYELYLHQKKYLCSDRPDMQALYKDFLEIEMPVLQVVADMEDNGVLFDMEYQQNLSSIYNKKLEEKLDYCHELISKYDIEISKYKSTHLDNKLDNPINIGSSTQVAILFYDIIGYSTEGGRGTGEAILRKLNDPIADAILEYREVKKLLSTYIDKLPNCVNPKDGRIHCKFNSYGADTGRFSSNNPNLQNIPSHNKDIRKMFIASPGYVLMSSDYSQQEPKCLAALCKRQGDSQMFDTFMQGKDLYSEIASKAFNKPYEECKEFNKDGTTNKAGKERRTQAKSILLGVLYGRGVKSIAEQLGCTPEKAQTIKDSVFKGFPAIKRFEDSSLQMAQEVGYVTTVCERKRRLPALLMDEYEFQYKNGVAPNNDLLDFNTVETEQEVPEKVVRQYLTKLHRCKGRQQKETVIREANENGIIITDNGGYIAEATRQTVNARIQGSAADLTKLALINLNTNKKLKELGFRLLIPVHDEVIAECPEKNVKECSKLLAKVMSDSAESLLGMPVKCDVTMTREWYGEEIDINGN